MSEQRPWTYYRARLAGMGHDPEGNAEDITNTRRLMVAAKLRHRAVTLSDDITTAGLGQAEREELAALIRTAEPIPRDTI